MFHWQAILIWPDKILQKQINGSIVTTKILPKKWNQNCLYFIQATVYTRYPGLINPLQPPCCSSIPPENIRKPLSFLFSRVIVRQYQAVWTLPSSFQIIHPLPHSFCKWVDDMGPSQANLLPLSFPVNKITLLNCPNINKRNLFRILDTWKVSWQKNRGEPNRNLAPPPTNVSRLLCHFS